MPCRCDDWGSSSHDRSVAEYTKKIDELTQNLCFLCGEANYHGVWDKLIANNPRLSKWWKDHARSDTSRVMGEMKRSKSLNAKKIAGDMIQLAERVHPVSLFHKEWFEDLATKVVEQKRKEKEKKKVQDDLKKEALSKLTPEERKVLGV